MGHTPGPWVIDDTTDDYEISIVGHPAWPCTRYGEKGKWDVCKLEKLEGSAAEERANAHLIAASPDLLEALKALMAEWPDTHLPSKDACVRASAAIARATGASV